MTKSEDVMAFVKKYGIVELEALHNQGWPKSELNAILIQLQREDKLRIIQQMDGSFKVHAKVTRH